MSNRADAIALRSMLYLSGALALVVAMKINNTGVWMASAWNGLTTVSIVSEPNPASAVRVEPAKSNSSTPVPPFVADENYVAPTPIPIIPVRVLPRTRLRIEPSHWSAPLYVPTGQDVGIKFTLGRIRVERDGTIIPGVLYRNPPVVPVGDGSLALRPLASLDHTPRVIWFEGGVRTLRFLSLEKNQSEEVEVLWRKNTP